MPLKQLAYILIGGGVALIIGGLVLLAAAKLNIPLGRLPGDIHTEGKHWSFSFPIVTCLVISVLLTLIMNLFFRR